jgi:hypothetical protein
VIAAVQQVALLGADVCQVVSPSLLKDEREPMLSFSTQTTQ